MVRSNIVNPTDKQIRTVNNVIAGDLSLRKAMQQAGYSNETSRNPKQNFYELKGVQKYLAMLDEKSREKFNMSVTEKALEVYLEALNATKIIPARVSVENGNVMYKVAKEPDYSVRIHAADRILKLYNINNSNIIGDAINSYEFDGKEVKDFNRMFLKFIETL